MQTLFTRSKMFLRYSSFWQTKIQEMQTTCAEQPSEHDAVHAANTQHTLLLLFFSSCCWQKHHDKRGCKARKHVANFTNTPCMHVMNLLFIEQ